MLNKAVFIIIISLLVNSNNAASQSFQRTYGSTLDDQGNQIILTRDNNYAIIGVSKSNIYLLKIDSLGNSIWQKYFAPQNMLSFLYYSCSFKETSDSGFIIAGNVGHANNSHGEICLIKTNSFGDTLWIKYFSSPRLAGTYPAMSY